LPNMIMSFSRHILKIFMPYSMCIYIDASNVVFG
jgi:hypothetical protein